MKKQKPHRKQNTFITKGDITECYDTQGNMFLIDTEDLPLVTQFYWSKQTNDYIVRPKDKKLLHRILTDCPKGKVVDHINHLKYDNRKANLRVCSYTENQCNRLAKYNTKYGAKGIFLDNRGKYRVTIILNRKSIHIGYFDTLEQAIEERRKAENEYYGEFSLHNSVKYKGGMKMNITYAEQNVKPVLGSLLKCKKSGTSYLIVYDRSTCEYKLMNLITSEVLMTGRKEVDELLSTFQTVDCDIYPPNQLNLKVGGNNG